MLDNNVIATTKALKTTPEKNKTYTINEEEITKLIEKCIKDNQLTISNENS
jgi:hypothetical protein